MKRLRLGKIAALLLLPVFLFAEVNVSVDKTTLYKGDSVTFTIAVSGKDIEFPEIASIDGSPVLGTSSSQSINVINGNYQKTVAKSYTFAPKRSLQIPSYKVLVDGGVELTKPVTVKIVEPSQDKNAPIVLDMRLSKVHAHVGEAVRFDLVLKQKPNVSIYKFNIEEPVFEDFWVKKIDGDKQGSEGEYTTTTYSYLLFPQKSGTLTIPAVTANIAQLVQPSTRNRDPFFDRFTQNVRNSKIFSNAASLEVQALPDNLELYGDFNLKVNVDKTTVAANKPVNLTISIDGVGNIDDIKKYSLDIDGAVIYANAPEIKGRVAGEDYLGSFEQKIVIIADRNYTIPPLTLRYFDRTSQKEIVKKSDAITIRVNGTPATAATGQAAAPASIEIAPREKPARSAEASASAPQKSWRDLLYAAAGGFVIGATVVWLILRNTLQPAPRREHESTMAQKIKKAKGDKALFELLLPYKNESKTVSEALYQLEENLYRNGHKSVDRKGLIRHFNGEDKAIELV